MTLTARRLIGAPSATPLAHAEDRLDGLSANPHAAWVLWHARGGWMVGRVIVGSGEPIDAYGPHVCARSAAFTAESLEQEFSRYGDPVSW